MAPLADTPRWAVAIVYQGDAGPIDVHHAVEELEEIADLVERGPDWNALVEIRITLQRTTGRLTLEQAEAEERR